MRLVAQRRQPFGDAAQIDPLRTVAHRGPAIANVDANIGHAFKLAVKALDKPGAGGAVDVFKQRGDAGNAVAVGAAVVLQNSVAVLGAEVGVCGAGDGALGGGVGEIVVALQDGLVDKGGHGLAAVTAHGAGLALHLRADVHAGGNGFTAVPAVWAVVLHSCLWSSAMLPSTGPW